MNAGGVVHVFHLPEPDILTHAELVAHKILEDDTKALMQALQVKFAQVMAVKQDLTFGRVIQTGEQLDQGGLASAVPDVAELTYKNEYSMDWMIDTKGEQEYIFSGHVILAKPTVSYGIFSYGLIAAAGHPSITRVTDSVTIYLDAEGKQVEESQARMERETGFPLPTPPPDLTIVPETPFPTIIWPTATPLPSPTLPAYP